MPSIMPPAREWPRGATSVLSGGPNSWWSWYHLGRLGDLFRELLYRDLKLRYRGSLLGVAWTLLNPLAELLVLFFIFGAVLPLKVPNYAAFLFTGLMVYGWFQSALNFATAAIVGNRDLIKRPGMPSAILPIVTVASHLVHFLLALPVLGLVLVVTDVGVTKAVWALPLLIAIQFVLILGLAYPVAVVHVWFRDTQHLLRIALQLLFYLTPIFYEATAIPERYRTIYDLNPMVSLVDAYRAVLVYGRTPDPGPLLIVAAASTLGLLIGVSLFTYTSHRFVDEL
jgi:lipopolysaccharide transport system permease protein